MHTVLCVRGLTQTFSSLLKAEATKETVWFVSIFINIKPLTMLLSPGYPEKQTTEQRLQSSSKIARHTANCYKTARCTVKCAGREKNICFKSERKEILIKRDIFTGQSSLESRGDLYTPILFSCLRKSQKSKHPP